MKKGANLDTQKHVLILASEETLKVLQRSPATTTNHGPMLQQ